MLMLVATRASQTNMANLKSKKLFVFAGIVMIFLMTAEVVLNHGYIRAVLADDENERDNEDAPPATAAPAKVIDTSPSSNTKQKTEYITVYKKLSDTVTTKTDTITRHDSDGDGLYDDEDPHPTINEYFIVKDDNLNGIDDRYEQQL
jgi:hypothetical protein